MKKKIISLLLAAIIMIAPIATHTPRVSAYVPDFDIYCDRVFLINTDTDTVIFEKNSRKQCAPASITKLMTALVVMDRVADIDNETATAPGYVFDLIAGLDGSTADIQRGETMTIHQLLACLLIQSANEAALILADHICNGDIDAFCELMNQKAAEFGMTGTHYSNPHGLEDPNLYTTAYDTYLLASHVKENPVLMELCTSTRYTIPETNEHEERILVTTNQLMDIVTDYYYGDADGQTIVQGLKTGYTDEAGRCLASTASWGGVNYICICMGAPTIDENGDDITTNYAFEDTTNLYDWVFYDFEYKQIVTANNPITSVKVRLASNVDEVTLVPSADFSTFVPSIADASSVQYKCTLSAEEVDAPVKKGDVLGRLTLVLADQEIGVLDLVASESVERSQWLYYLDILKTSLHSFWFKLVVGVILGLIVLYIIITIIHNHRKRRRRKNRIHTTHAPSYYNRGGSRY